MAIEITHVSVEVGDTHLRGCLFLPTKDADKAVPALVLAHGLGSGGRTMDGCARDLAKRGIAALWFDQRGHGRGDTVYEGDSSDDIIAAATFLRRHPRIDQDRVGVMGHSSGARDAIIACVKDRRLASLVCTSTPADLPVSADEGSSFVRRTRAWEIGTAAVSRYPHDGPLPWLEGWPLRIASWIWEWVRGHRLRVNWRLTFDAWSRARPSVGIAAMDPRPTLFVHSQNDRTAPVEGAEILLMKAQEPKQLFVRPGGFHSTPVKKGPLRSAWIDWAADQLTSQRETA